MLKYRLKLYVWKEDLRAIIQRVKEVGVEVDGEVVGRIGKGMLILLGAGKEDTAEDVEYMVEKALGLRIFEDPGGLIPNISA